MRQRCDAYRTFILIFALAPILIPFSSARKEQATGFSPKLLDYEFQSLSLESCVRSIAEIACLSVILALSAAAFSTAKVTLKLQNASAMRALNIVLTSQQLK